MGWLVGWGRRGGIRRLGRDWEVVWRKRAEKIRTRMFAVGSKKAG